MKIKKAFKILTPLIFLSSLQAVIVSSCNSNNKPSPDPTPSDVKTKKEFKACCINADQGQFNIEYTNNKYTDCNLTKASKDFKAIDFNFNNGIISSNDGFEYIITSIGDHAFENNTNLVGDIYIPNTIKSIGKYSFTHSGLNGIIHIPDSIDSIGSYAFADTKIQILDLTEHTSKIINYANNIVNESAIIYVPKDLLQAYKNAEGWNTIADRIYAKSEPIPPQPQFTTETLDSKYIGGSKGTFDIGYYQDHSDYCQILSVSDDFTAKNFNFNDGIIKKSETEKITITNIKEGCFKNCLGLTGTLTIPSTISHINPYTFAGCLKLNKVVINEGIDSIDDYAFAGCESLDLETIILPNSLENIGKCAFKDCHKKSNITIGLPKKVKHIGNNAFENVNMKALDLTTIDHVIDIDSNPLSDLGFMANNNVRLISINSDAIQQQYLQDDNWKTCEELFRVVPKGEKTEVIPASLIGATSGDITIQYKNPNECSIVKISSDFLSSKNLDFSNGNISYKGIKLTITNIKEGCFKNCLGLTNTLTIPSTISHINPYTFAGCLKLNKVVINEGIDSIDDYAFAGCESLDLETIILPNSLENIGKCAFKDCNKICKNSTIKLQNSIKHIADGAFSNSNIETLNLEDIDHVIEIDSNPLSEVGFLSKNSIKRITFVDETINHIFSLNKYWLSCQEIFSNIETVTKTFLASTISGETGTFTLSFPVNHTLKSTLLSVQKDFVVDSNFWNMNNGVFKYNDQNYQICSIAANAFDAGSTHWYFKKCNLVIPSTVKTIGDQAFYGNSRNWGIYDKEIIGIQFNEGLEDIGKEAFYKCNDLIDTTIKLPNSIKHIGDNAFSKTNMEILDLTTLDHVIDVDSDLDSKNSFLYDTKINKIIFKDDKILNLYANDSHWSKYKNLFVKESDKVTKNIPGSYFIYGTTTIENHGYVTIEFNHNNPLDCKIISVKDFCVGSGLTQETFDFNKGKFNYGGTDYQITSIGKDALRPSSISSFFTDIILQIPSTIKTIEDGAFYGNSRNWGISDKEIIGIQFNECLEDIGKEAFYKCNDLIDTTIKLPNSVKHIGDNAFGKTNIEILDLRTLDHVIDVDSDLDSKNSFLYDTKINKIIFKDDKILNLYANDSHWSKYKNLFVKESDKVTKSIPAYVFAPNTYSSFEKGFITIEFTYGNTLDCKIIKADNDVAIEDCDFDFHQGYVYFQGVQYRITSIGDGAFKPKSIRWFFKKSILQIPFTVKTIGDQAFYGNSRNTSLSDKEIIGIEFNEGLEDIGKEAFYKCNDLIDTTIKLPNSIKHISDNAFSKTNMEILDLTTLDHVIDVDSDLDSKNSFLYDTKINKIIFKDDKILNLYANNSHWSKYKNLFKIK